MDINLGRLVVNILVRREGIDKATAAFTDFAKTAEVKLNRVAQKVRTVGYLTTAVFTYPMVAGTRSIINVAKDFEYEMQKIVGLTGVAQEEVDGWRNSVLSMSRAIGKGPVELAESLYFITSSGIRSAEALEVLRVSAMAAEAGLGETMEVADLVTSVLNAYTGTGITAAEVTDQLVAAVRVGKAEADEFASAIGQVIPIAAQLGVSFAELSGGIAAMTLQGASASNAAVYFKNLLNALMKEAGKTSPIFKNMNANWAELRRILREEGLLALMQKLYEINLKYDESLVKKLFPDIRAMTGELMLVGKNYEYNAQIIKEVIDSSGSLKGAWDAVSDTAKVKLDRALSSLQTSFVTLGKDIAEAIIPVIEDFVKWVEKLIRKFESLTAEQKKHKLEWIAIVAALGPVSLVLSSILYIISFLITVLDKLARGIKYLNALSVSTKVIWAEIAAVGTILAGVVVAVAKGVKEQREAMEKNNKIYRSYLDSLKDENELRETTGELLSRYADIDKMNSGQLRDYQNQLAQEIALWEDKKLKIEATTKAWKENNQEYQTLYKNWKQAKEQYEGWSDIFMGTRKEGPLRRLLPDLPFFPEGSKKWREAKASMESWEATYKTLDGILKSMEAKESARLPNAIDNLNKLKGIYDEVTEKVKKYNKEQERLAKLLEEAAEKQDKYFDIVEGVDKGLQFSQNMTKLVGDNFDSLQYEVDLYRKAIEDLLKLEVDYDNVKLQEYVEEYKRLKEILDMRESIKDVIEETKRNIEKMKEDFEKVKTTLAPMYFYEKTKDTPLGEMNSELERQIYLAERLSDVFQEFFEDFDQGWKSMLRSLVREFERYVAELLAMSLVFLIIEAVTGGGTLLGAKWLTMLRKTAGFVPGFAKGGVVPPGYPNDTYPALLSSGEVVFTPSQLRILTGAMNWSGEVRFEIEDDKLVGVLERRERRINSYR